MQECHSVLYEEGKEKASLCSRLSVPAIDLNILTPSCVDGDKLAEDVGEHQKKMTIVFSGKEGTALCQILANR